MTENYFYPDTHEIFELYDVLEALLSKKDANIGLFDGAEVSADPSLDFLIRILFTPVEDRCSYLSMLGGKVNKEYGHTLEDIKAGTYQGLSEDQLEKKRKEWIEDIRKTDQPMLRILKAIKYGREVETWETKKYFLERMLRKDIVMRTKFTNAGKLYTDKAPLEKRTEITKMFKSGKYTRFELYEMYPAYIAYIDKLYDKD